MKTTIRIFATFYFMLVFSGIGQAQQQQQQQEESYPHRYLGLGIRISGIQIGDFTSQAYPTNRLVLDIDAHKYFRLEGQLGIYSKTSEVDVSSGSGGSSKLDLHTKSTFIGFGIMGMYPKEHGRFVAGLRYSINNYSDESINYNPGGPTIEKSTGKMNLFSGMIGGEYFLARFFSIGAEFSISSVKDVYDDASPSASSTTDKTLLTESNLILRFYPF